MKILHIADLHLGKKIYGYSLIDDQKFFLDETIKLMKDEEISHLIIAGDIYDISNPAGEAITLFSDFLKSLKDNHIKAFIVPGNHDSKARTGYASKILNDSGIYINSDIKEALNPIEEDGINYYLIPYTTSAEINAVFNQEFKEYKEALRYVVSQMIIDKTKVNIAVSHQFVLNGNNELPSLGNSEEPAIGDIIYIPSSIYQDFTYTALGHIHKPQNITDTIRYCGSPFPYHIDEVKYNKEYTILEINDDAISIKTKEIEPRKKTVVLRDTFDNLLKKHEENRDDYVYAVITDGEKENAMGILKEVYPYIITLSIEKKDIKGVDLSLKIKEIENVTYPELFSSFYKDQCG